MSSDRTQDDVGDTGAREGERATFWRTLAHILLIACLAYTVLSGSNGREEPGLQGTQVERASDVEVNLNTLSPFAKPDDTFDLNLEMPVGEAVHFNDLRFDHKFLANGKFKVERLLNLSSCASRNCSIEATASWEMKGEKFSTTFPLVKFFPTKQVHQQYLIGKHSSSTELDKANETPVYRAYFQSSVTLSPVVDFAEHLLPSFLPYASVTSDGRRYGPIVYVNNFWVLRDHLLELNATTTDELIPFTVEILPLPSWKLLIYSQYEASIRQQEAAGLSTSKQMEEMKRIALETNPYFLALTALVTCLHMLFEFLALTNDVKFWRGRKDLRGLSVRSVAINCYFQTITFLYLLDIEETSWAILLPHGAGVVMEYWKLMQTVTIRRVHSTNGTDICERKTHSRWRLTMIGYEVVFKDTYDKRTRKHDTTAVRYLVYTMVPILAGYCLYSAVYETHKSWYSYVIHSQVKFIYFFGFAMMTPQIFINYKMKSVGQMPWRTFVYKALNTVIDDLFAFIIKMPWLHRLACFRDDVVFAILLYQRWVYPVDMSRMADEDDDAAVESDEGVGEAVEDTKDGNSDAKKKQ